MRTTEGITTEATTTLNSVGNSTQNELDLPSTPRVNAEIADGSTEKRPTERENGGNLNMSNSNESANNGKTRSDDSKNKSGVNDSATGMRSENEKTTWNKDENSDDTSATKELNEAYNEEKKPNSNTTDSKL